jgi:hypothetical protein
VLDARAILEILIAGDDPVLAALRVQSRAARIVREDRTDVGFFVVFEVADDAPRVDGRNDFVIDDVAGEIDGLEGPARFLLSVNDGALDFLEGSVFGFRWPPDARVRRAYYLRRGPQGSNVVLESSIRDLDDLRRRWSA